MKPSKTKKAQLISWTKVFMIGGGFWNQPLTNSYIGEKVYFCYSIFMKCGCFMWWSMMVGELFRLVAYGYDVEIILAQFGLVVNASKIMFKLVVYIRENLLALFKDITEKDVEIWNLDNEEIHTVYWKNIKLIKSYVLALSVSTSLCLGMLDVSGIHVILKTVEHNKAFNDTLEAHAMYQTILPLNKLDNLPLLFTLQAYLAIIGFVYNCLTHLMFATLLVYAATQIQILQIRSKNFIGADQLSGSDMRDKLLVLKEISQDHQYIIGFVENLNSRTRYIVLVEFILSSFDLASVSVNLITLDFSSSDIAGQLIFNLSFFVLLSIQISILGWSCNEIKCESEELANALYASNWYLLNPKGQKMMQIMMARAQKPLIMTIGPFGAMTTNSVLAILKGAYSYVSIMRK
ncbi:odorant receptor Or2 isoform X1 [Dendroctonus ponderosae]|uniref:Odorant receptor n=1 Tax=Dendroctonus ponderosae TaxID=77166 RepID=J3JY70_DENPD|nr:odorant receptor Or2 isoform X1 [Dendroctonus ponderosae]AEE63155.1 unknown [Dendroctonus ponderosae]ERL93969.1 hypothetical protein D910_11254 [Dendroctonus ponderosae]